MLLGRTEGGRQVSYKLTHPPATAGRPTHTARHLSADFGRQQLTRFMTDVINGNGQGPIATRPPSSATTASRTYRPRESVKALASSRLSGGPASPIRASKETALKGASRSSIRDVGDPDREVVLIRRLHAPWRKGQVLVDADDVPRIGEVEDRPVVTCRFPDGQLEDPSRHCTVSPAAVNKTDWAWCRMVDDPGYAARARPRRQRAAERPGKVDGRRLF